MLNKRIMIPKIRFSDFKNKWNTTELEKVSSIVMGQSPSGKNYTNNPSDFILVQGNADMKDGLVVPRVWTTEVTRMAKKGSLILSVRAPVGEIGKTDFDVVLGRGVSGIEGNEFIYQSLIRMKSSGYWTRYSTGSTFESINSKSIKEAIIFMPESKEQDKIGDFFKQLDNIISLQQQLLNDHKQLKKAMLQKMFPQKGESVPRIRFAGFNDVWKKHRLGEYFDKYQNTIYLEDETRYKQITVKNTGLIEFRDTKFGKNIGRKRQYVIDTENYPNTLTFTRQTIYEGGIGFVPNILNGAIVTENMPLLNMKKTLFKAFIMAVLKSPSYYKNVIERNMPIGSAQKALHEKDWLNSYLFIPNIKEQEKIGNYFKQLDETIALHEQKLETYQDLKKAMLQKMFV